jgi:hypothetical protein
MKEHSTRMKKWSVIVAVTLLVVFEVADLVRDFITNDPIHYFAQQPGRLLWVAAIAIGGGLLALILSRI